MVTDFEYKPDTPSSDRVCTEVFAFDGPQLLARLDGLAEEGFRRRLRRPVDS